MGKKSLLDSVREWIGGVAFRVFLWSIRMTQDEYIDTIIRENKPLPYEVYKDFEQGQPFKDER